VLGSKYHTLHSFLIEFEVNASYCRPDPNPRTAIPCVIWYPNTRAQEG
jgi:hypothetical protein